jgi:thiamine pyrophosphokinase
MDSTPRDGWHPAAALGMPFMTYAVVILNTPLNTNVVNAVLEQAEFVVCADAGADRLRTYEQNAPRKFKRRKPDAIIGDLDSLTLATREHYAALNTKIVHDPDQNSTDLTKCLKWLRITWPRVSFARDDIDLDVVVLGGLGGRVDQGFSQIHHLYMASQSRDLLKGKIFLLSEESLTFVLDKPNNEIYIDPGFFEENVGIIPVLGLAHITTRGLEWDVTDWPTQLGGQVSTSNHIRRRKIDIFYRGPPPLFTIELGARFTNVNPR